MNEVKFETKFLNEYFQHLLGKETFYYQDLNDLKNIVLRGNNIKITQHDFDILQDLQSNIQLEGIDVVGLNVKYAKIKFVGIEPDKNVPEEDIQAINSLPVDRILISSFQGFDSEVFNQINDRFKYSVIGDALAYKNHFYTYYTKQEIKQIVSKLEEIKSFIPKDSNDITKFMIVYKWIGIHADYNFLATSNTILKNELSYAKEKKKLERITRSLWGVLVKGEAVCEGYSWALKICLDYVGIQSRVVCGLLHGNPHAWVQVNLSGKWYNACLTEDRINIKSHKNLSFCLRTNDFFIKNGYEFKNYNSDINEKSDIPLEKCMEDYPRNDEEKFLYDKSIIIDDYYDNLMTIYQILMKNKLDSNFNQFNETEIENINIEKKLH